MNPVVWFEIAVNDMEAARAFYQSVFEIEMPVTEMGGSLMAWFPDDQESPGVSGSLVKGKGYVPSMEGSMVYFHTQDIEATLGRVEANGGRTLIPKQDLGEHGFFATFEDNQGNRVALHTPN